MTGTESSKCLELFRITVTDLIFLEVILYK